MLLNTGKTRVIAQREYRTVVILSSRDLRLPFSPGHAPRDDGRVDAVVLLGEGLELGNALCLQME